MATMPWEDFAPTKGAAKPIDAGTVTPAATPAPANDAGPWQDFGATGDKQPTGTVPDGWTVEPDKDKAGNRFATSPDGKHSVNIGPETPTHDVTKDTTPHTTSGGAIVRGLSDAIPFVDYGVAAATGRPVAEVQQERANNEKGDKRDHPWLHYGSEAAGLAGAALATGGLGELAGAAKLAAIAPRAASVVGGAGAGALYGAGEGTPDQMYHNALGGAAGGAIGGAVAPAIGGAAMSALRGMSERVGLTGAIAGANRGLDMLSRRAPQDADRAAAEVARYRAAGQEPTPLDVMDQSGRDVVAAAHIKAPNSREATRSYAQQRAAALPTDTDAVISVNVSPTTMSTPELRQQVQATLNHVNNRNYGAIDPTPVPLDDAAHIKDLLASPGGRQAVEAARKNVTDADMNRQLGKLDSWAQTKPFDPAKHMTADQKATYQAMADMRDKVGGPAKAQFQAQMDDMMQKAEASYNASKPNATAPTDITHAAVDKVRKAAGRLATAASKSDPTLGDPGEFLTVKNALADHLEATVPGHAEAKAAHGAYSRVLNAIDGSGQRIDAGATTKVNGSDLVDGGTAQRSEGNYQNFEPWANKLSDEQLPLHHADGRPITTADGTPVTISERSAARASAANQMRVQSQAPVPARSMGRNFEMNNAQTRKADALLGPADSAAVTRGLAATGQRADNAAVLAGRGQSPTARLTSDAEGLGEAVHAIAGVASLASGHAVGALRSVGQMMRRAGLNPEDAHDLVNRAIDQSPGAADDFIAHLRAQGVSRNRAQIIYNNAKRAGAIAGGQAMGGAPGAKTTKRITVTGE